MRETGPASITPSGVPADRRDAAALALTDATLAEHVATLTALTALTADGLAPAGIAQAVAAAEHAAATGRGRAMAFL